MKGFEKMAKIQNETEFDFYDINKTRLDEEWVNQPRIYYKYSELLTDAKEAVERCKGQIEIAKDEIKEVVARIDLAIRKDPVKYLGEGLKPTESAISNRILLHPKYAAAKEKIYQLTEQLIELNTTVSTGFSAVTTLEHRKSALERLVSLHGQNYFSTPKASDEFSKESVENIEKIAARRKIGKARKNR